MFPKGNTYVSKRCYVRYQEWFDDNWEMWGVVHWRVIFGLLNKEREYKINIEHSTDWHAALQAYH